MSSGRAELRTLREPEGLIATAIVQSGLDDFGGDWFRDGLEVLVESLRSDVCFTTAGAKAADGIIVRALSNRLQVEEWYRLHPEVASTTIAGPTLVVGLPRSGTTALVGMLAEDDGFRSLRQWEAAEPCPPPVAGEEGSDRRVLAARAAVGDLPEQVKRMHIFDPLGPEEDHDILSLGFRGGHFSGIWPVTAYTEWWLQCDMRPAWVYHERVLRLLGSRRPPDNWLLKAPLHLFELVNFLAQYPNARFVMTHRDPAKVVPSVCDFHRWIFSTVAENVDLHLHGAEQLAFWAEGVRRAMAARELIGEDRFIDVFHDDLVADPMREISRIYDFLGREMSEEVASTVAVYRERNASSGPGTHEYSAEQFGLRPGEIRDAFAAYIDRFNVVD